MHKFTIPKFMPRYLREIGRGGAKSQGSLGFVIDGSGHRIESCQQTAAKSAVLKETKKEGKIPAYTNSTGRPVAMALTIPERHHRHHRVCAISKLAPKNKRTRESRTVATEVNALTEVQLSN